MSKTLIILIALVGGILLGVVAGTRFVDVADVIGTLWLNGLRMTVVPLVVALRNRADGRCSASRAARGPVCADDARDPLELVTSRRLHDSHPTHAFPDA